MPADLTRLDLRLRRRSMLLYALGLAVYTYIVVAMYPSMRNDAALSNFVQGNETAAAVFGVTGSLTTPSGWMNGNLSANFLPLLVLLLTIGYGASAIAGQSEAGLLGMIATLPVSRARLAAEKAATVVGVTLPTAVATVATVLIGRFYQVRIGIWPIVGTTLTVALLGVDFGILALAIGAATGRRGTAIGVTAAMTAISYLISSLSPVIGALHHLRTLSLFYWAVGQDQLDRGPSVPCIAVLTAVGIAALAAIVAAVQRLDIP